MIMSTELILQHATFWHNINRCRCCRLRHLSEGAFKSIEDFYLKDNLYSQYVRKYVMFLLVQCLVKPTEQQQCIVYRDSYLFFAVVLILVLFKPQWMISQKYSKARNLFQRTNL